MFGVEEFLMTKQNFIETWTFQLLTFLKCVVKSIHGCLDWVWEAWVVVSCNQYISNLYSQGHSKTCFESIQANNLSWSNDILIQRKCFFGCGEVIIYDWSIIFFCLHTPLPAEAIRFKRSTPKPNFTWYFISHGKCFDLK